MIIDGTVYPDLESPPDDLPTPEDKADYVHRICAAFDFGVFPEDSDWEMFREWKDVFDRFPFPSSPAWHTFRWDAGWAPLPMGPCFYEPPWVRADAREGRTDPCEHMV